MRRRVVIRADVIRNDTCHHSVRRALCSLRQKQLDALEAAIRQAEHFAARQLCQAGNAMLTSAACLFSMLYPITQYIDSGMTSLKKVRCASSASESQ